MPVTSRWVMPCHFSEENHKTEPIQFDLTSHLQVMLSNKVWERKFNYGFNTALQNTDKDAIVKATVTIYPRFISGYFSDDRLNDLVGAVCGELPEYLKVNSYRNWSEKLGLAVIETEYSGEVSCIPGKPDPEEGIPQYERGFLEIYHQHIAVLKELAAFFLAGLHLSFPTRYVMMSMENPLSDGFYQISCAEKTYAVQLASSAFMHEVLIETSRIKHVTGNLKALATVWHHDLWPLKRFLIAVETDNLSMDHLLDLIYALEGLFEKNTSSDFIKTMCVFTLAHSKKEANEKKALLDLAFRIRNHIAHGERSYTAMERVPLSGKEILAQDVYWEMKGLVAIMILHAIAKLMCTPGMKTLRFKQDDLYDIVFK